MEQSGFTRGDFLARWNCRLHAIALVGSERRSLKVKTLTRTPRAIEGLFRFLSSFPSPSTRILWTISRRRTLRSPHRGNAETGACQRDDRHGLDRIVGAESQRYKRRQLRLIDESEPLDEPLPYGMRLGDSISQASRRVHR